MLANQKYLLSVLAQAKAGNHRAQNIIIQTYWDSVFFYVNRKIKNENDAEDITIKTFTKVLSKLNLYNKDFNFKTWIISIAHNTMVDHIRKSHDLNLSLDDEFNLEIPLVENSPEEGLILQQSHAQFLQKLNQLKEKYRKILELRYIEDKSYKEISIELNLSLANVKVRLMRARKLFAEILGTK